MKRNYKKCLCILWVFLLLVGCARGRTPEISDAYMYYVNTEGTGLVTEPYDIEGGTVSEQVESTLGDMQESPESVDFRSAFLQNVSVDTWEIQDKKLALHFSDGYLEMDSASQVLLRSAVVQTMVQIQGVESVGFFIGDAPATNEEGEQIGYQRADNFVQNTGSSLHSYQLANLTLYYANKKGDKLAREEVSVRYNSNMSIEKLIVEQLIKGPAQDGHQPTIPPETKLLSVSVKDGICYVNLDNGFQSSAYSIDPQIIVYSIVNSITEAGNAGQVQISINGETDVLYKGITDISKPFSRNYELEEGE